MKIAFGLLALASFMLGIFLILNGAAAIHPGLAMIVMGFLSFFLAAALIMIAVALLDADDRPFPYQGRASR